MTATVIGMIVDEGALEWSSTIEEVFPARSKRLNPAFRTVTLAQLLAHKAGLPHDGPWWQLGSKKTTTEQRGVLLSGMLAREPESTPGTKYAYSNVGYALAGLMAEQATGKSWEVLMRTRLFEPLGMTSAGFGPPGKVGQVVEPWGHRVVDDRVEPVWEDNAPAMGPAGTVHVPLQDWAKFAALHLRGAQGKPRLLEAETFRELHTPAKGDEYVGGWFALDRSWAGGRALMHSGSNTTWYATVWIAPVRDFAVLVATNQGGDVAGAACDEAISELIKYHSFSKPTPSPVSRAKRVGRR
jgi:CubicO group peptidase (beta-lactamase class C family)